MLGKEKLSQIANQVLKLSSADQTEVLLFSNDEHLTRFAVNTIHQNVSETDVTVRVRAVFGKKTGVASGNDLSAEALQKTVKSAEMAARFQQDNPDFHSLPKPQAAREVDAYFEPTATYAPEQRAQGVAAICAMSRLSGSMVGQKNSMWLRRKCPCPLLIRKDQDRDYELLGLSRLRQHGDPG